MNHEFYNPQEHLMLLRGKDSEFVWIFNTFALSNRKLKETITGS